MKTIYLITSNDGDCTYTHCVAATKELADEIVQRFNKEYSMPYDQLPARIAFFDKVEVEEYSLIEHVYEANKVILCTVWLNAWGKETDRYIQYLWPWDAKRYTDQHPDNMILDQLNGKPGYDRIKVSSFVSFEDAIQRAKAIIEKHRAEVN